MLIVGLLLLAAAVLVGVAGVAANTGSEHSLVNGFGMFGYHVHGSSGKLFLAGLVIGAVGMLGFLLATEGLRRNAALRRELFRFRRQARVHERAQAKVATKPSDRVLARTAPAPATTSAADTTDTGTRAAARKSTDTSTDSKAAADTSTSATPAEETPAWRRTVSNWRSSRPTS